MKDFKFIVDVDEYNTPYGVSHTYLFQVLYRGAEIFKLQLDEEKFKQLKDAVNTC